MDPAHHRFTLVHSDEGLLGVDRVSDQVGAWLNTIGTFATGETVFGGAFDMRRIDELRNGMNRAHTLYRSAAPDGSLPP